MARYYSKRNKRHVSDKRKWSLKVIGDKYGKGRNKCLSYHCSLWWVSVITPRGDWVTTPIEPFYFGG